MLTTYYRYVLNNNYSNDGRKAQLFLLSSISRAHDSDRQSKHRFGTRIIREGGLPKRCKFCRFKNRPSGAVMWKCGVMTRK